VARHLSARVRLWDVFPPVSFLLCFSTFLFFLLAQSFCMSRLGRPYFYFFTLSLDDPNSRMVPILLELEQVGVLWRERRQHASSDQGHSSERGVCIVWCVVVVRSAECEINFGGKTVTPTLCFAPRSSFITLPTTARDLARHPTLRRPLSDTVVLLPLPSRQRTYWFGSQPARPATAYTTRGDHCGILHGAGQTADNKGVERTGREDERTGQKRVMCRLVVLLGLNKVEIQLLSSHGPIQDLYCLPAAYLAVPDVLDSLLSKEANILYRRGRKQSRRLRKPRGQGPKHCGCKGRNAYRRSCCKFQFHW